jgi:tRNA 2-thiouridine synthesizing protein A
MLVRNRIRELAAGEVLHIVATDPSTHRDFSNFCRFMDHEMLQADVDGERLEYWIKKQGA